MNRLTPMMRQYKSIKEQYHDCLLFFRLGDFYEMFFDDALVASKELEIVLTGREGGMGQKIPMCGVPFHAVDSYIAKLIAKGFKIAICEQVEDPKSTKGIVKREVIRVITPGTVVESQILKEESHNYLLSVCGQKNAFGLAYTDISTGEFFTTEIRGSDALEKLADEICCINPAECILPENLYNEEIFHLRLLGKSIGCISRVHNEDFVKRNTTQLLCMHFKTASLESLGLHEIPLAALASAYILVFLQSTQKRTLDYLDNLKVYSTSEYMLLDASTRRNLEITSTIRTNQRKGSLLWVCDKTKTPMGARLLKDWLEKPLLHACEINQRLDGVEELFNKLYILYDLQKCLSDVYDLERLVSRISYGTATPRDILALKNSLVLLPQILKFLAMLESPLYKIFLDHFDLLDDIVELLEKALVSNPPLSPKEGGIIKDGYNQEVDELRRLTSGGKKWLMQLEAEEREKTGIKSLKVGFNKVFGYYIEITNANINNVPDHYIRKQTLANAERYITEELKAWESKILTASERVANLEYDLFCQIRDKIARQAKRIKDVAEIISHLDVLQSLATIAGENNYCRPQVNDENLIQIQKGRHPVIEKVIGSENYVPNDTYLGQKDQEMMLLTGPNMAGKSTYMRQVALIVLMSRIGSFVPAKQAVIGKIDRIFTRVGAHDDLAAGQSTFMVEMCETSNILRHAGKDSLIILDEIGRGTSTFDGLSIAWAVAEYIIKKIPGAKTLFATHYHELTTLADDYEGIKNYCVSVKEKEGKIIFLRKIIEGGADKSYGIQVASLAGLPQELLLRAKEILIQLESERHNIPQIFSGDSNFTSQAISENISSSNQAVIDEIISINPYSITPIEALLKIGEWQKRVLED
ncbi:MAG: DNA mismatch repair protein MutS [Bacillota bacterium]